MTGHETATVMQVLADQAAARGAIANYLALKAPKAKALIAMHRREQRAFELLHAKVAAGLLEEA